MKYLLTLVITIVLVSCGATVAYDYDTSTDFSGYKSYNYYPNLKSNLSNLDNTRIIKATDSILLSRGFEKSESPQLLINFFATEFITQSSTTIGIGLGTGGYNGGVGVSGGIPVGGDILKQKITFDFIDNNEDKLIWQAVGNDELKAKANSQQKDVYYYAIISKILKGYPPKK
tara:strand:- start:1538 stop:2056 length:519 start_codon:yes stop_codon:yes gene_type:complete